MRQKSELILNTDGSIYHLKLKPGDVAPTIITVGDPNRVTEVTKHFDSIELSISSREFKCETGFLNGKLLSVVSTGIGTDNIDIVLNEIDALFNLDLETGAVKSDLTEINFIRIGTSGTLQESIPVDSFICSKMAIGFEGLLHSYQYNSSDEELQLFEELLLKTKEIHLPIKPYLCLGSSNLFELFSPPMIPGITLTAGGFYAPQGRRIRLNPKSEGFIDKMSKIDLGKDRITNLEMETAGIYGLSRLLGHHAISLNAILANRATKKFSQQPKKTVESLISKSLEIIIANNL